MVSSELLDMLLYPKPKVLAPSLESTLRKVEMVASTFSPYTWATSGPEKLSGVDGSVASDHWANLPLSPLQPWACAVDPQTLTGLCEPSH